MSMLYFLADGSVTEETLLVKLLAQLPVAAAMLAVVWWMLKWASKERADDRAERKVEREEFLTVIRDFAKREESVRVELQKIHADAINVLKDNAVALARSGEQAERLEGTLVQLVHEVRETRKQAA